MYREGAGTGHSKHSLSVFASIDQLFSVARLAEKYWNGPLMKRGSREIYSIYVQDKTSIE